ncbi:hypothetical protein N9L94_06155 [Robiginitalea sp.]|jgi:hypothetical protein|nr:hypothetical protein [Robiginitalea sp.]|tara:strand:- start:50 stop:301 length:252 start_codon:yes stop_codon:yes gene_type:complete
MQELELLDKAMNVGYNMLLGKDEPFEPTDSDEIEDMIFIPDPELTELEMAEDLLEYFESTEEYEKCANIRDVINLKKVINKLI